MCVLSVCVLFLTCIMLTSHAWNPHHCSQCHTLLPNPRPPYLCTNVCNPPLQPPTCYAAAAQHLGTASDGEARLTALEASLEKVRVCVFVCVCV